jgi:hypothetical protein
MQRRNQEDRDNQRPVGRPRREIVNNTKNDVDNIRPRGNSVKAALRRLRKDRLDLHERVQQRS